MLTLVTGGAGFVGRHLVRALLDAGGDVRILDSFDPQVHGAAHHQMEGAELLSGDVRDEALVARALEGVERVVHLAAAVGVGQSMYQIRHYVDVNCTGTAVLLEALLERRDAVRKLIVASSMSIYGEGSYHCPRCEVLRRGQRDEGAFAQQVWEPLCPVCGTPLQARQTPEDKPLEPSSVYAVTKRDQEELCLSVGRAYQIPTVALRFFNIYGSGQALSNPYTGVAAIFSSRLLNGRPPVIYEDGNQRRDFVHVSDIVQGIRLSLERDSADYTAVNLGTGRGTSVLEMADLLTETLGPGQSPVIEGRFRQGDIRHCFADIARARDLLGYEPAVRLEDGIGELVEWVRSQEAEDNFEAARRLLEERGLTR
jgi:dTDP-L-rhamnose 4-epimerase